jgi:hypothetical protein
MDTHIAISRVLSNLDWITLKDVPDQGKHRKLDLRMKIQKCMMPDHIDMSRSVGETFFMLYQDL